MSDHNVYLQFDTTSFPGDASIAGDLHPGALIAAGGSLTINGQVSGATILALGNIHIEGGAMHSRVMAGTAGKIRTELRRLARPIEAVLNRLLVLCHNNLRGGADGLARQLHQPQQIAACLDRVFARAPGLRTNVDALLTLARPVENFLPARLLDIVIGLTALRNSAVNQPHHLISLGRKLRQLAADGQRPEHSEAVLALAHGHGCDLASGGSIQVQKSLYSCTANAFTYLQIGHRKVGGHALAADMAIESAGSRGETLTTLELRPGGTARIGLAYPGVIITGRNRRVRLTQVQEPLHVRARRHDPATGIA
ncbi:MAG: FapA family protein [Thermaerobacterales bacterium]